MKRFLALLLSCLMLLALCPVTLAAEDTTQTNAAQTETGVTAPLLGSDGIRDYVENVQLAVPEPVELTEGVIAAKRHIHMTPADAETYGVKDKQIVSVKIDSERSLVFGDVVVRVNPNFALAMHIDTDESNAAAASGKVFGEIIA